jgi:hypothetical protein
MELENTKFLLFCHTRSENSIRTIKWIQHNIKFIAVRSIFVEDDISKTIVNNQKNKIKISHVPTLLIISPEKFFKKEGYDEIVHFLFDLDSTEKNKYYEKLEQERIFLEAQKQQQHQQQEQIPETETHTEEEVRHETPKQNDKTNLSGLEKIKNDAKEMMKQRDMLNEKLEARMKK